jgi:hypothetical protein
LKPRNDGPDLPTACDCCGSLHSFSAPAGTSAGRPLGRPAPGDAALCTSAAFPVEDAGALPPGASIHLVEGPAPFVSGPDPCAAATATPSDAPTSPAATSATVATSDTGHSPSLRACQPLRTTVYPKHVRTLTGFPARYTRPAGPRLEGSSRTEPVPDKSQIRSLQCDLHHHDRTRKVSRTITYETSFVAVIPTAFRAA